MNKYSLYNIDYGIFDNLSESMLKNKQFEDEIMQVCSADNICKLSKFEKNELENLKVVQSKIIDIDKKQLFENNYLEEFISKEIFSKFNIKISKLKQQIKSNNFKIVYFQNIQKESVTKKDFLSSVKYGQILNVLYSDNCKLNNELRKCFCDMYDFECENFKLYNSLIIELCDKKDNYININEISKKFSQDILNIYLIRKTVYLILLNFEKDSLQKVVDIIKISERFKSFFCNISDEIVEKLICGNK